MDPVEESSDRAQGKEQEPVAIITVVELGELHPVDGNLDTASWQIELGETVTVFGGKG